jgi:hypothetical protein
MAPCIKPCYRDPIHWSRGHVRTSITEMHSQVFIGTVKKANKKIGEELMTPTLFHCLDLYREDE